jgi:hypothetical protein
VPEKFDLLTDEHQMSKLFQYCSPAPSMILDYEVIEPRNIGSFAASHLSQVTVTGKNQAG